MLRRSRPRQRRCRDRAARGRCGARRRAQGLSAALRRHRAVLRSARCARTARALAAQASSLFLAAACVPQAAGASSPRAIGPTATAPWRPSPARSRESRSKRPRSWSPLSRRSKACRSPAIVPRARSPRGCSITLADQRAAPLAERGRDGHRLLPRRDRDAARGGQACRHDRQGGGHRHRRRGRCLRPPLRSLEQERPRSQHARPSPPSSAGASNIIRGSCSRSRSGDERDASQIAGGGRYDGLLANIGAPRDVPAIGSAIHTERLLAAVERRS